MTASEIFLAQLTAESAAEVRTKLETARSDHAKAQKAWTLEKKQLLKEVEDVKADYNRQTGELLGLQEELRSYKDRQALIMQETLASEKAEWVANLPKSAEGRALAEKWAAKFLKSEEYTFALEDKLEEGFERGFNGCVSQLKSNTFPLSTFEDAKLDYDAAFIAEEEKAHLKSTDATPEVGTSSQAAALPSGQDASLQIMPQISAVAESLAANTPPPAGAPDADKNPSGEETEPLQDSA